MRHLMEIAAFTAVAVSGSGLALAQSSWENELAIEIAAAQHCKVAYYSHVVERVVKGKKLVMAKAHCDDERVFDAMRPDEIEPFRFNECQPDPARAC